MSNHVPQCPACGAKFSHDNRTASCSKCGLPDEITTIPNSVQRGRMIARWRKRQLRTGGSSKRQSKRVIANKKASR